MDKLAGTLGESRWSHIPFRCTACPRNGVYAKASLVRMLGASTLLADVALHMAIRRGCEMALGVGAPYAMKCGVYVDLAAIVMDQKRAKEAHAARRG